MTRQGSIRACRQRIHEFAKNSAPLYQHLEWRWGMDGIIIPEYKDILRVSTDMMGRVEKEEGDCNWGTGGIEARVWADPSETGPNWNCTLGFTYEVASYDEEDNATFVEATQ